MNTFDIHKIEFLQIQCDAWSTTLDLRLQLIEVPRLKMPTQMNQRDALARNPFDLQCHELLP